MSICYFTGEDHLDHIAVEFSGSTHYDVWLEEDDDWGILLQGNGISFYIDLDWGGYLKLRNFEAVEVDSVKGVVKIWRRDAFGNRYDSDPGKDQ